MYIAVTIYSNPSLKRADVDWDNLESTESVYEDDVPAPAAEKQPAAVSESEVEEAPVEFEDSVVEVVEATEAETVTHTDEALEFEVATPVIEETYEQPVIQFDDQVDVVFQIEPTAGQSAATPAKTQ